MCFSIYRTLISHHTNPTPHDASPAIWYVVAVAAALVACEYAYYEGGELACDNDGVGLGREELGGEALAKCGAPAAMSVGGRREEAIDGADVEG